MSYKSIGYICPNCEQQIIGMPGITHDGDESIIFTCVECKEDWENSGNILQLVLID